MPVPAGKSDGRVGAASAMTAAAAAASSGEPRPSVKRLRVRIERPMDFMAALRSSATCIASSSLATWPWPLAPSATNAASPAPTVQINILVGLMSFPPSAVWTPEA